MGRYRVDWKRSSCLSAVLHLGAKWVNGSLGSRAQYLSTTGRWTPGTQGSVRDEGTKSHCGRI